MVYINAVYETVDNITSNNMRHAQWMHESTTTTKPWVRKQYSLHCLYLYLLNNMNVAFRMCLKYKVALHFNKRKRIKNKTKMTLTYTVKPPSKHYENGYRIYIWKNGLCANNTHNIINYDMKQQKSVYAVILSTHATNCKYANSVCIFNEGWRKERMKSRRK